MARGDMRALGGSTFPGYSSFAQAPAGACTVSFSVRPSTSASTVNERMSAHRAAGTFSS